MVKGTATANLEEEKKNDTNHKSKDSVTVQGSKKEKDVNSKKDENKKDSA